MDNLLGRFAAFRKRLKDKNIYLFLDFDGTLTSIADTPEKARISDKTRKLLEDLSKARGLKIAIVSGRSLADIRKKIGLENIIYVGNHGLEIEGPKISFNPPISVQYRKILEKIKNVLEGELSSFKGILIEDKGLSLSLHFRLVKKKDMPRVKTIFHESTIIYYVKGQVKVKSGKKVLEVRPAMDWNKGKVVLWLLARQRFVLKGKPIFPIYIGDDLTDEDAFRVLRNKGATIVVGKTKESLAEYYLGGPGEVKELLKLLLREQD